MSRAIAQALGLLLFVVGALSAALAALFQTFGPAATEVLFVSLCITSLGGVFMALGVDERP